jgi:hypothetical protein
VQLAAMLLLVRYNPKDLQSHRTAGQPSLPAAMALMPPNSLCSLLSVCRLHTSPVQKLLQDNIVTETKSTASTTALREVRSNDFFGRDRYFKSEQAAHLPGAEVAAGQE